MPKANEVAMELRKLADALDSLGELSTTRPMVSLYFDGNRDDFLSLVKVLPHPLEKQYDNSLQGNLTVTHKTDLIWIRALINRSSVCRIIEPAKPAVYDCDPILSLAEEESLIGGAA